MPDEQVLMLMFEVIPHCSSQMSTGFSKFELIGKHY
jgi:hypothetical protein